MWVRGVAYRVRSYECGVKQVWYRERSVVGARLTTIVDISRVMS